IFIRPFFGRTDITPGEVTWVPRGADWRTMNFERERLGSYGAFQWRPNDETEVYFTVFRSEYDMNWDEDAIFVSNDPWSTNPSSRSEEHTSELQSRENLVCRLLLEKKKKKKQLDNQQLQTKNNTV